MVPLTQISEWTLLLLMMIYESVGSPELICPDVGYLGSPAHLTCIPPSNITSHGYTTSQGEVAAICSVSNSSCTPMGNYMASTINQTHSSLTISAVQQTHAGQWTCTIPPWSPLSCNFTVVKLPTCFITSDADITTVDVSEELSLTVHIKGYYCSELVQLKVSTGRTDHEYPNETVTNITDKTVNIKINKTNTIFEAELVFTCGGHSTTQPCNVTNGTPSSTLGQNITPGTPNDIDIIGVDEPVVLVTGTVTVTVTVTIIIIVTYVCFKRRTIQQKVQPVLECPDPPYMELREPLHNTYDSVEDLGAQGSGSKKDTSPPCTEAYADTENYAAVGDTSVPDTKTRKDDPPVLRDAGGYSTVSDRRVTDKGTQGDVTAKSLDTDYYKTVEDQNAAALSVMQGDLPLPIDAAGYLTVAYRQAAETSPQREDTANPLDTGYYEIVEHQSAAALNVMQGDLPVPIDAAGYLTVAYRQAAETNPQREDKANPLDTGYYEIVEDQSAATLSVMQEDLPLPIDAAGYLTVAYRQAAETSPQREDTANPLDTDYYEIVEDQSAAAPSVMQGDLPVPIDDAGYLTVAYRQTAETSPQREDTANPLDTDYYEIVEDQSAAAPSVRQGDLHVPLPIDAAGYSTVAVRHAADKGKEGDDTAKPFDTGLYVNVDVKSDAQPNLRQGDLPALTDAVGYSTVDDFKPCPGAASFSHTGKPESVPNQIEEQKTNRPLCELYAAVNKKRGTPRLASAGATTTSVM